MPRLSTWSRGRAKNQPVWHASLGDHVIDVAWSPDDSLVAAASVSGPVVVLDASDGTRRAELPGHGFGTTALAWVSGGVLVSAGQDGRLRWWDVPGGGEIRSVEGGAEWVEHLAVGPDRRWVVSSAGRKPRLWDADGSLLREYPDQPSTVSSIRWRPGSTEFTTAAYGGITVWTPDADEPARRFVWKGSILNLAWSPNGKFIATGNQDSTVHFWIYETGEELQMWGYPTKVRELAWDRSSRFLATGGGPQVTVWDCSGKGPSGTKPLSLIGHDEEALVTALIYQSRGDTLASGGTDGRVIVWNPTDGRKPVRGFEMPDEVSDLAWSHDERSLAVAGAEGRLVVLAG